MKKDHSDVSASNQLEHFHRLRAERQNRNLILTHSSKSSKAIKFAGLELFREDVFQETYQEKPVVKPMSDFIVAPADQSNSGKIDKIVGAISAILVFTAFFYLSFAIRLGLLGLPLIGAISLIAYWGYINRKKDSSELRAMKKSSILTETKPKKVASELEAAKINEEELVAKILSCANLTAANNLAATASGDTTDNEPLYNLIERLVKEDKTRLAEQLSRRYLELLQ